MFPDELDKSKLSPLLYEVLYLIGQFTACNVVKKILKFYLTWFKCQSFFLDSKITKQIALLGKLLPPKGRVISDKKHWKFSVQECIDSMIICANVSRIL